MSLDGFFKVQLDAAAKAISRGWRLTESEANIFGTRTSRDRDRICRLLRENGPKAAAYLAERVEHHSSHRYTVRVAIAELFEYPSKCPDKLSLVRCDYGTPEGEVTEFVDGMILIEVRPVNFALIIGTEPASPESIARRRANALQRQQRQQLKDAAAATEKRFLDGLFFRFRRWLELCDNPSLKSSIEEELDAATELTLAQLSLLCVRLGVTLDDVAYCQSMVPVASHC